MEAKKNAEEFSHGYKADSSVKGKEAMRESEPIIYENSIESEILMSSEEKLQDLQNAPEDKRMEKRAKFNGGAFNSSEKADQTQFQQIYGLAVDTDQDCGEYH